MVTDVNDILEYYNMKKVKQITIDDIEEKIKIDIKPEYQKIYDVLKDGRRHINQISIITKLKISEVNSILLMMELEGLIRSLPGNNYEIL